MFSFISSWTKLEALRVLYGRYVASPDKKLNKNYLGPASIEEIAKYVFDINVHIYIVTFTEIKRLVELVVVHPQLIKP